MKTHSITRNRNKFKSGTRNDLANPALKGIQAELEHFSNCIYEGDDIVEVRCLPRGGQKWVSAGELPLLAADLLKLNSKAKHIYVGANPRVTTGGSKNSSVVKCRTIFADFDQTDFADAERRRISVGLPEPTLVVNSGHGIHAYWRLSTPARPSEWTPWQRRLSQMLESDPKVVDAARIMRVPGFLNHKQPPAMCAIVSTHPDRVFAVSNLEQCVSGYRCEDFSENETRGESNDDISLVSQSLRFSVSPSLCPPDTARLLDQITHATLPTRVGERYYKIFELCRRLKAIPRFADAPSKAFYEFIRNWHRQALPVIGTKPFDETWVDFTNAWASVRFPFGTDPLSKIQERVRDSIPPEWVRLRYDNPVTHRLITFCLALQAECTGAPFFLSCRKAGELLGIDHRVAARLLKMLVLDGVLRVARSGTTTQATRYWFVEPE